ncbi:hypothetical protein [Erwinia amylovora]|uniref:Uncharacterized protein n=3 Tax=Erwinia amylovora TaxID=552 RepID=A0A831A424_ERWAM|nr:hypothetical protein [Erwinia amylovora]ATZ13296.1 hypothetical protein AD997_10655 [Erwinia amylovora]EKV54871.1 hypothetical protein EaACW_2177 [Erwinia amylovora ACW56400]MBZ2389027.1 hypothetical protein [Erwinia amylovora]MBZ2395946.1 hypothetical protein [Erwinia amylovora]MBZ2400409.1 hypothetical protein [Erwinia amylovora]
MSETLQPVDFTNDLYGRLRQQAEFAVTLQPQLRFFADRRLPLIRVGALVDSQVKNDALPCRR